MITWLTKLLPFLGTILDKVTGNSESDKELARARAQVELEEAKAFRKGKYSPRYVLKYAMIVMFCLFCLTLLFGMFFPYAIDINHPLETIERLAKVLFSVGWQS